MICRQRPVPVITALCRTDHKLQKDEYKKSALFYINKTFYVDKEGGGEDYASIIKKFRPSAGPAMDFSACPTLTMHETLFRDLSLQLGQRCVYLHSGGCAHYMQFTAVRLWHPRLDPKPLAAYPYLDYRIKSRMKKCDICVVCYSPASSMRPRPRSLVAPPTPPPSELVVRMSNEATAVGLSVFACVHMCLSECECACVHVHRRVHACACVRARHTRAPLTPEHWWLCGPRAAAHASGIVVRVGVRGLVVQRSEVEANTPGGPDSAGPRTRTTPPPPPPKGPLANSYHANPNCLRK